MSTDSKGQALTGHVDSRVNDGDKIQGVVIEAPDVVLGRQFLSSSQIYLYLVIVNPGPWWG